jgi:hypothetical protein
MMLPLKLNTVRLSEVSGRSEAGFAGTLTPPGRGGIGGVSLLPRALPWAKLSRAFSPNVGPAEQERVLQAVAQQARTYAVATILGTERLTEAGRQIAAFVFEAEGRIQGYQTKNQIDPSEVQFYVPGTARRLFEINRPE